VKITLLTTGTRGDTQPYVALGVALRAAGRTATVAAPAEFEQWIRGHSLAFAATDGASPDIMSSAVVQQAMRADNPVKVLLSFHKLKKLVIGRSGAGVGAAGAGRKRRRQRGGVDRGRRLRLTAVRVAAPSAAATGTRIAYWSLAESCTGRTPLAGA
jgi:hypothetical protein